MLKLKQIENMIGLLLTIGTLFSALLVIIGGILYLLQYGSDSLSFEILQAERYTFSMWQILPSALSFSSIAIIELGLLALVATQLLRVALLTGYYAAIRDYYFVCISLFILTILIYSFFWRK